MARLKEEAGPRPIPGRVPAPVEARVRRQQIVGILIVVAGILVFALLRADWHNLFPRGWWRW